MEITKNSSREINNWYTAYYEHLMLTGIRYGYGREELKDIINQLFLDLIEKQIEPFGIHDPKAYLTTAFKRKLIDHYRKVSHRIKFILVQTAGDQQIEPSIQDRLEKIQANKELITAITKAYSTLPERCQKVIKLKFYKGLNTDEIAEHTGLSKRSVYNNLFEGIKLLRAGLNQASPGMSAAAFITILPLLLQLI